MANESDADYVCHRYVDDHPDLTNEPIVMFIFAVLYIHIFILGIVGNVAVLYLTLKNRHLQSVQNIFILNLAASDVLMCLTSLPITPITNVYKTWFFASPVCKLIPLVQGASVFVSTFSLSAIALDRYNLVVRPHRHPLRSRGASVVALLLWIISALVCMPYGWYMDVEQLPGICGEFCTERWPSSEVRKGYALMVLVMQFILPFATMAVCYYTIFARLRER
ncbi:7 transmembrane receptor [Ancylostoma duodenale]|uniref:7 transmembrane receptor n=1 Tax=Ancylostoma duodenale TaxID=51022 RepID=A0A0C2GSN6_9BILA|nr:7 transmembrane receptor [Ancylostoma duodenale]